MYQSFSKESLQENDIVVYLKNERTGSSTVRKCKFIGQIIGFKAKMLEIRRLSNPDTFVYPDECQDCGIDIVRSDEVVHILYSEGRDVQDMINIPISKYRELLEYEYKYHKLYN